MKNLENSGRRQHLADAGFTLIELLIVMSVMLILMTLAIPTALNMVKKANHTSAQQSIRAIYQAETQYASSFPANGFSCSLSALGGVPGSGSPSATQAQILDPALASGSKSGYIFAITNCTKVTVNNQDQFTGYEITAVPSSKGRTGDRGFCSDEGGIIKFDPSGGTDCTQPVQ